MQHDRTPTWACEPETGDPPRLGNPPPFDMLSGPSLACDTLEAFVVWAATVPVSHVASIRQRIAACRVGDEVADALMDELWTLPVTDMGRHRMILSIIGELRDERVLGRLEDFIWYEGELAPTLPHPDESRPCMFETDAKDLLQSRAAEMLSYLATREAVEATMKIARDHPSVSVRAAAIDAHLFNHDDSPDVAEELSAVVRASDRSLVGLPRKVRGADVREFERSVGDWYEQNPKQRPPRPKQQHDFPPPPRSRIRQHDDNDEGSGE